MADSVSPLPAADRPREPWGSWSALLGSSADPIFLLSRRRQLRYANRTFETLTGKTLEALRGAYCLPRKKKGTGPLRALLQTLAPPPEAMEGRLVTLRRPVPPQRLGPPWWEITFIPLRDESGLTGILSCIRAVARLEEPAAPPVLNESLAAVRQSAAAAYSFDLLDSESNAMHRVAAQARLASKLKTPLWFSGEPGTGKETIARIVHFNGATREHTFLCVDCGGLQPFLIRNMLFGLAGQVGARLGTVYLKDPEMLPRDLQSELHEWYEEQDDPPRIICGSTITGDACVMDGRFLEELVAAFNVLEIRLPPLRERVVDLGRLAIDMLRRENAEQKAPELAADALDRLTRHNWPGNLRELSMVLREAFKESTGGRIEASHLPLYLRAPSTLPPPKPSPNLDEVLETVEARMIRIALLKAKGNKTEAADLLGIQRSRLIRRIEVLKIDS
jgi:DNA-binding NtrC family response regulator